MEFILILAIPVAIVWIGIAYRYGAFQSLKPFLTLPNLIMIALISGCVLGHEFFHLSVGPIPLTIDRGIWGCMLLLFGYFVYRNKIRLDALNRVDFCVIGLLALIAFSTFSHDWRYRENEPMGRLLFFNIMPVGFYLVARNLKLTLKELRQVFGIASCFGIYLALTAIAEVREWDFLVWPRYISNPNEIEFLGRARGPMMNPVANGMAMLMALSGTLMLWPKEGERVWLRGYVVGAAALISVGVFSTMTRSVWLCLPLVYLVFIWIPAPSRFRGVMTISATVVVAIGLVLFGGKVNSFQRDKHVTVSQMSESASLRPMLAYVAWQMFEDRPIMGCGFGQYTRYKRVYHLDSGSGMPLQKVMPYMQHNIVLSYLTELGMLGVGFLGFLVLSTVYSCYRMLRWRPRGELSEEDRETVQVRRMISWLMLVMAASWMLNGMFHDVSIIPMVGSFMYFLFGLNNGNYSRSFQASPAPKALMERRPNRSTTVAIG